MDSSVLVEQACERLKRLLSAWPKYHGDFQRWIWKKEEEIKTGKILKAQGREPLHKERSHASTKRLRFQVARRKPS